MYWIKSNHFENISCVTKWDRLTDGLQELLELLFATKKLWWWAIDPVRCSSGLPRPKTRESFHSLLSPSLWRGSTRSRPRNAPSASSRTLGRRRRWGRRETPPSPRGSSSCRWRGSTSNISQLKVKAFAPTNFLSEESLSDVVQSKDYGDGEE